MERVYVGNLPPDIRIKDIDDFFRPFGKLIYIDVNHRANPVYAYVQFDSARNAYNAVKLRHGYDYEGYTLQLRLVENEVRKRRDATPPPPPPPMLTGYGQQNNGGGFNNDFGNINNNRMGGNYSNSNSSWSNNNRSGMPQQQQNMSQYSNNNRKMDYPTNNRSNMQQHNLMPYSISGRSNTQQQYSNSSIRSNMQQQYSQLSNRSNLQQQYRADMPQQFSNSNRSDMPQQYSNSNRSDMPQQYSNSNRSDMQQQYYNSNRSHMPQNSDMVQQNMTTYSNSSNMSKQQNMNMMDYTNNTSWNTGNNMGWNGGNGGNNYNNVGTNEMYDPNNDPYARSGYEDKYTSGLSGSGRKWFHRYIRKGFSPKIARSKALEHRTVPTLRDPPTNDPIPNDSTNMALETIGNTIISLLSTNQAENFNNDNQIAPSFSNWGGNNFQGGVGNYETPGPSSSVPRGKIASQAPRNAASKQQYLKSLTILKKLGGKRTQSAQDRLSKKYHTQIVKDYERLQKNTGNQRATTASRNDKVVSSTTTSRKSPSELSVELRKKKQQLFLAAKLLNNNKSRFGGAFKKRMKILINEAGFTESEAKCLAVHPLEKLQTLISLKKEYDISSKINDYNPTTKKPTDENAKMMAYHSDIDFLRMFDKQRFENLSTRVKSALRTRLNRIHKFEKERAIPLTKSKFIKLLENKPGQKTTNTQKKEGGNKIDSNAKKIVDKNAKKIVGENKTKAAAATSSTKKEELKADKEPTSNNEDENAETAAGEPEANFEDQDNEDQDNEDQDNEDQDNEDQDNENQDNEVQDDEQDDVVFIDAENEETKAE